MPQPIDPQTEVGRATAAERIQQIADRASLAAQSRVAAESADLQRNLETQVQHSAAKGNEVEQELRRRNPFMGRRKKREKGKQSPEKQLARNFYNASEKAVTADDPMAHDFDVEI